MVYSMDRFFRTRLRNINETFLFETFTSSFENVCYNDGPACSGKTFLHTKLLHHFRPKGEIVVIVAVSGIAALLLPSGRTAH